MDNDTVSVTTKRWLFLGASIPGMLAINIHGIQTPKGLALGFVWSIGSDDKECHCVIMGPGVRAFEGVLSPFLHVFRGWVEPMP